MSVIGGPRIRSLGLSKSEIEAARQRRLEQGASVELPTMWITCADGLGAPARGSLKDPGVDTAARGRCREDIAA